MNGVLMDVRQACRSVRGQPGLSVIVALTLGCGIGAGTAAFSLGTHLLLRPYGFAGADRVVTVELGYADGGSSSAGSEAFRRWRTESDVFDVWAGFAERRMNFRGGTGSAEVFAAASTPDLGKLLGEPLLGRWFRAGDAGGDGDVVVMSHGLWVGSFGRSGDVVGETVWLDGVGHTVIGVAARDANFPAGVDLWVPLLEVAEREQEDVDVLARLKEGVSIGEARAVMDVRVDQYARTRMVGARAPVEARIGTIQSVSGGEGGRYLEILVAAVVVLMVVACANTACLLLARGGSRRSEYAVRLALGASRFGLVRHVFAECVGLAALGGAVGVLMARVGIAGLKEMVPVAVPLERVAPGWNQLSVDDSALAFALLLGAASALIFGMAPALEVSRVDPARVLAESAGGRLYPGRRGLMGGLVTVEVTLATILCVTAGVLMSGFAELVRADLGIRTSGAVSGSVRVVPQGYVDSAGLNLLQERLLDSVRRLPGVTAVGLASHAPLHLSVFLTQLQRNGEDDSGADAPSRVNWYRVTPGYTEAMGISLLRGRRFTAADARARAPVALISQGMAERYWAGGDALSGRFRLDGVEEQLRVIGIVNTVQHNRFAFPVPNPQVYMLQSLLPTAEVVLVARFEGNLRALALAASIREVVADLDPDAVVSNIRLMQRVEHDFFAVQRIMIALLSALAVMVLAIAAVGVYGIVAYAVGSRMHEIGVRQMAGATRLQIVRMLVRQAVMPVCTGVLCGIPIAVVSAGVLAGALFGGRVLHPSAVVLVVLALLSVSVAAGIVAAWKAVRVGPNEALRANVR